MSTEAEVNPVYIEWSWIYGEFVGTCNCNWDLKEILWDTGDTVKCSGSGIHLGICSLYTE